MIFRRSPYEQGIIGIPDVAIAVFWIALWVAWPSGENRDTPRRKLSGTRTSYFRFVPRENILFNLPDSFIQPTLLGRERIDEAKLPQQLASPRLRAPRFFERSPTQPEEQIGHEAVPVPIYWQTNAAQPFTTTENVFNTEAGTNLQVLVELSDTLKKRGFRMPELLVEQQGKAEKQWTVVAYAQFDEDGLPVNIFLETRCGDQKMNSTVIKTIAKGRLATAGEKCDGHIIVNYGTR
jgi:hypothetical protein